MSTSEIYSVELTGVRPMLQHSCKAMIDNIDKPAERKKEHIPMEEAEEALYKDAKGNIIVESEAILACLRKVAVNYKIPGRGKKTFKDFIYAGVRIEPFGIPLISKGGWELDLKIVVVNRSRIVRARPRFDDWKLQFNAELVDPIIRGDDLKQFFEDGGKYNGLLDFRPLFGLFELTHFEKLESNGGEK